MLNVPHILYLFKLVRSGLEEEIIQSHKGFVDPGFVYINLKYYWVFSVSSLPYLSVSLLWNRVASVLMPYLPGKETNETSMYVLWTSPMQCPEPLAMLVQEVPLSGSLSGTLLCSVVAFLGFRNALWIQKSMHASHWCKDISVFWTQMSTLCYHCIFNLINKNIIIK